MIDQKELNYLEELSLTRDRLADLVASSQFEVLKELILDPMQKSAFEAFKKTPADQTTLIIETQMMSKMVDQIYKAIEGKIELGKNARQRLSMSDTEE